MPSAAPTRWKPAALATLAALMPTIALAEVSSALILLPWQSPTRIEARAGVTAGYDGTVDRTGNDIDLTQWQSIGRVRLSDQPGATRLGWRLDHLDIDTADTALPQRLSTQALALGLDLGQWERWQLGATVGGGYAGNAAFNDNDAWHGLASLTAQTQLDRGAMVSLALDYNGNRSVFPDLPLPAIAWSDRYNDQLRYTIGFPINAVTWTPDDRWTVKVRWLIPVAFSADIDHTLTDDLTLFAAYLGATTAYHIEGDNPDRRLFFQQDRVETGARWQAMDQVLLIGAVGYAFNQSFERGWDVRDTTTVRDISDEPFIRLALRVTF